jgi:cell division septation protein DedD
MLAKLNGRALAAMLLAGAVAAPALADVKAGVDAWSRGDYAAAVREWEGPAATGDADALFNLAQAYRLGRGVPTDLERAEQLYARAAAGGHVQAADTYGLMLFQDGRREQALPYVTAAAGRGDARSQYLLGIAHFNGDLVEKNWVRAYALLILANDAGLPQAGQALAEMDQHVPLADRQQAAGLAIELRGEADAARAAELAAAELAEPPRRGTSSSGLPRPIASVALSPSVAAARAAVAEASQATGTESPAEAGATFAQAAPREEPAPRAEAAPPVARTPAPAAAARSEPAAARPAPTPATRPAAVAAGNGPWRVQLGAFSVRSNAEQLWQRLSKRSELAGARRLLVPAGAVTKLQAGGYASRTAADAACRTLKRSGHDCLVTRG